MNHPTHIPSSQVDLLSSGLLGLGTGLAQMLKPQPVDVRPRRAGLRALLAWLRNRKRSGAAVRSESSWPCSADVATRLTLRANGWR